MATTVPVAVRQHVKEAARLALGAQADDWWRRNTHATVPHSQTFDSSFDDNSVPAFQHSDSDARFKVTSRSPKAAGTAWPDI